ncbi:DUF2470 domain-containing protein [Streptomyces sp. NPDC004647]|uniref:DUF2470 domain-containing protein n=1 Tax=Streptomyces sp. NPDC004647 TaxID=3154671 RepID=UPI0033A2AAC7
MFRPGSPLPSTGRAAESATDGAQAGQPRPLEDVRQPSAAERVRTLVESNASAALSIPGADLDELGAGAPAARTVTPDGDVLLLVPGDSTAARAAAHAQDDDLTAVIEITDVAPVAVPHRIRGRGWLAGWLTPLRNEERAAGAMLLAERHPVGALLGTETGRGEGVDEALGPDAAPGAYGRPAWMLLRLEVGEGAVDDLWGAESVEPDDFAAAEADPLVQHEAELLQHLAAAHGDQVRGLCGLLGDRAVDACGRRDRAVPVALDRFGLRVRFTRESRSPGDRGADSVGGSFDARFDFPEPVRDVTELQRAMHVLFEAALHSD